jgi:hypothetical protein
MKEAGMTCEAIVTALECIVVERNIVTPDVTPVTPAAVRMRRMRERKSSENNVLDAEKAASVAVTDSVTERNKSVTTYNSLSSLEIDEGKKERIVGSVTRKRNSYAQDFELFWAAFPTDAGMSKLEASKVWERLTPEDKIAAHKCIPAFKAWVAQQGQNYRVVHACRYLSQRRFEGFTQQVTKVDAVTSSRVYVTTGTDAMDAWDDHYKRTRGKLAPRDQRGGWWFDSEYPPSMQEKAA